jgi:hypothetical protein
VTCRHNLEICSRCVVVTDAARRMSDAINLKIVSHTWEELVNGYMAFRLHDGTSDNVLYDSHAVAARHTDSKRCGYFCFRSGMGGVNARDCQILLEVWRAAADAGIPMAEPDAKRQPDLIISTWGYDVMSGRTNPRDKP